MNRQSAAILLLCFITCAVQTGAAFQSRVVLVLDNSFFEEVDTGNVLLSVPWGSNLGEIGLSACGKGEPQGAASFSVTIDGHIYILDQINGRIQKFNISGKHILSIPLESKLVDMIAVSDLHDVYVMDSISSGQIWRFSAIGEDVRKIVVWPYIMSGAMRLISDLRIENGELFVESAMEKKCYPLTLGGDILNKNAAQQNSSTGRVFLGEKYDRLGARIVDANNVEVILYGLNDKVISVNVDRPILAIRALESDVNGRIYLGMLLYETERTPPYTSTWSRYVVMCLTADGEQCGNVVMPVFSYTEARREIFISRGGTIYQLQRDSKGVRVVCWDMENAEVQ